MTFKTIYSTIEAKWWVYFNSIFSTLPGNTSQITINKFDVAKQLIQPLQIPASLLFHLYYMASFIRIVAKWFAIMIKQYRRQSSPPSLNNKSLVRFMLNDSMYNVKLVNNKVIVIKY